MRDGDIAERPQPDLEHEIVPSTEPAPNPDDSFDPAIDPEGGEPEPVERGSEHR